MFLQVSTVQNSRCGVKARSAILWCRIAGTLVSLMVKSKIQRCWLLRITGAIMFARSLLFVSFSRQVRAHVSTRGHRRPRGHRTLLVDGIRKHGAVRRTLVDAAAVWHADYSISGQTVQGKTGGTLILGRCEKKLLCVCGVFAPFHVDILSEGWFGRDSSVARHQQNAAALLGDVTRRKCVGYMLSSEVGIMVSRTVKN